MDPRELLMLTVVRLLDRLRLQSLFFRLMLMGSRAYPFTEYFKGFDRVETVRQIFGEKTRQVLNNLRVEFTLLGGYMWVNGLNGRLMVSSRYLNQGDRIDVYLDVIHELVHVRQFMEGRDLFDARYDYAERPTELEAYRYAVAEARRLGLSDERICRYLKTEWMNNEDLKKLARALNVRCAV